MLDGSHSALSERLKSITSVTVAVVGLEYEGTDLLPEKYRNVSPFLMMAIITSHMCMLTFNIQGFGYLVPSSEPSKILGVVFDSSTFPELDRSDQPSTRLSVT